MNEGAPQAESNVEKIPLSKEREQGIQHAESIVDGIEGYEQMDFREQYAALAEALAKIEENGNNGDRFAAEYLGNQMAKIKYLEQIADAENQIEQIDDYYDKAA